MEKKNLEIAKEIAEEAKKKGEAKFHKVINETLPLELEFMGVTKTLEHYHYRLEKCREWYNEHYNPFLDFRKRSWEEVTKSIKAVLDDIDAGISHKAFGKSPSTIADRLSERIMTVKYMKYLKALIDGLEERKTIAREVTQAIEKQDPAIASYADIQSFKRHNCTSKEFRQDISELCPDCPLPEKIKEALQVQILAAAQMKEVLPAAGFKEYLGAEINDAAKAMQKMRLQAQAPGAVLNKVTEIFIWNKERLKVLRGFLDREEPKPAPQAFGSDKLTMRQIAILHRYLGEEITVNNRNGIALNYGYNSATSGEKLYNAFNGLRRPTDRAGKHKYAIRDIEAILLLLRENYPGDEKAIYMAEDELNLAKVNNVK